VAARDSEWSLVFPSLRVADDGCVSDQVLLGQAEYYRRRAEEYDATAYGDLPAARERVARLVGQMHPTGSVLEIACGTGMWTEALAGVADSVLAIDVAPEVLAIVRDRESRANVRFELADVFAWTTDERFDVIFFSAWLSHVPMSHFELFWRVLRGLVVDGGRVLFVDEHLQNRDKETYIPCADDAIVERRLRDGSSHRIVKNFVEPEALKNRLRYLGWDCEIRVDGSEWVWVCGEARPAT
jgi:2-polyprenyl-3-methyl-5-hydroxy-6-metoxy-1,4-benzoquinol methylase